MPSFESNGEQFYLTNGSNTPPRVHAILDPASRAWQYIVADPSTRHAVIIDPIAHRSEKDNSPESAEHIIRLVESNGYLIDHILETESSLQPRLTAAWSLRMHFSHTQGYPPQLCSNSSVSALHRTFARRYGAGNGFSTTLNKQYSDKEQFLVGRMRVTVMHVPGFATPNRKAYLIDGGLFGAYSIAMPTGEDFGGHAEGQRSDPVHAGAKDDEQRRVLFKSMHRILSLPAETRVYYEEDYDKSGLGDCTSIERCRTLNLYLDLNENEFVVRRRGELRERKEGRAASSDRHKKNASQAKVSR